MVEQCQLNELWSIQYFFIQKTVIFSGEEKKDLPGQLSQFLNVKLVMNKAVMELTSRVKIALIVLHVNMRKLVYTCPRVFVKIFDSQIQSILLYSAEVWGAKRIDCIDNVHLFPWKTILNVGPQSPNAIWYGECGRFPFYFNVTARSITYRLTSLSMHEARLPKKAYLLMCLDKSDIKNVHPKKSVSCFHMVLE